MKSFPRYVRIAQALAALAGPTAALRGCPFASPNCHCPVADAAVGPDGRRELSGPPTTTAPCTQEQTAMGCQNITPPGGPMAPPDLAAA